KTIARDGVTDFVPHYTSDDNLCLNGKRLVRISGPSSPVFGSVDHLRTDEESFAEISGEYLEPPFDKPSAITVSTRDGRTLYFSSERTRRIKAKNGKGAEAEDLGEVHHVWLLRSAQDSSGNKIDYEYAVDMGYGSLPSNYNFSYRPKKILYTSH